MSNVQAVERPTGWSVKNASTIVATCSAVTFPPVERCPSTSASYPGRPVDTVTPATQGSAFSRRTSSAGSASPPHGMRRSVVHRSTSGCSSSTRSSDGTTLTVPIRSSRMARTR